MDELYFIFKTILKGELRKMKKKLLGLLVLAGLGLASCGSDTKTSTDLKTTTETTTAIETTTGNTTTETTTTTTTQQVENKLFEYYGEYYTLDDIKANLKKNTEDKFYGFSMDDFENQLPMPSLDVSFADQQCIDPFLQLIDILDYCAFYHLDEITINFDGGTVEQYMEYIRYCYWNSKLLVSIVNFTLEPSEDSVTIHFIYNEEANTYISKEDDQLSPITIPYTFYSKGAKRDINNDDFGYKDYTNGTIDVYNSDQLVYALENKYIPNPLPNSPAEKIFTKAKKILNNIIYDDMTLVDKVTAIQSFILSNSSYAASEDYACYLRDENHPDEIMSMLQAAYVEGVLDGKEGVCHGFAKTLSLLCSIEGIDNVKVSSPNSQISHFLTISSFIGYDGVRSYQSHGYVYIKDPATNLYYISDPTYSFFTVYSGYYHYRELAVMKAYSTWRELYRDQAKDLFCMLNDTNMGKEDINYKDCFKMSANGKTMDLYLTTEAEVDTLIDNLQAYIDSYSDSSFGENGLYELNVFTSDDVYGYAYSAFNNSNFDIPFINYSGKYPELGFQIWFYN